MEGNIHMAILLCIIFTPFCFQMSLHEPQCTSNFDFQEKLLSKSVKMDHQMQILQELVSKQLTELQIEKVSINYDLAKMATELKDLSTQLKKEHQQKNEELTTFSDTLNKGINNKLEEIETELKAEVRNKVDELNTLMGLQETQVSRMSNDFLVLTNETLGKMKDTQVAFSVYYPNGKLVNGVPLFTNIMTNIGGGYNVQTGQFTCTVPGLYLFSFSVMKDGSSNSMYCNIRLNNVNKARGYTRNRAHASATVTVMLSLKLGDVVDLGNCASWNYVNKYLDTGFTGALITEA